MKQTLSWPKTQWNHNSNEKKEKNNIKIQTLSPYYIKNTKHVSKKFIIEEKKKMKQRLPAKPNKITIQKQHQQKTQILNFFSLISKTQKTKKCI